MKNTLTIIWGLPWVWKSTLWDSLEKLDTKIVHCDTDKVFDTIIRDQKALALIWTNYIPEQSRLAFLVWDTKRIVKTIVENNEVKRMFHRAIFRWSINILKYMEKTNDATFWIISIDWTNKISRIIAKEQAASYWFDNINFIELTASKNELVKTARERQTIKDPNMAIFNQDISPMSKLNEYKIIERIKEYEPYNKTEKLFNKYLKLTRKEAASEIWIKKIANWIKRA